MQNEAASGWLAHQTTSEDREAMRRLAKATLSKAIEDAGGRGSQPSYSAICWLAGRTTEGLTFQRCCELIGIAPHTVRRSLRHYKPIRQRLEKYLEIYPMPTAVSRDRSVE